MIAQNLIIIKVLHQKHDEKKERRERESWWARRMQRRRCRVYKKAWQMFIPSIKNQWVQQYNQSIFSSLHFDFKVSLRISRNHHEDPCLLLLPLDDYGRRCCHCFFRSFFSWGRRQEQEISHYHRKEWWVLISFPFYDWDIHEDEGEDDDHKRSQRRCEKNKRMKQENCCLLLRQWIYFSSSYISSLSFHLDVCLGLYFSYKKNHSSCLEGFPHKKHPFSTLLFS